MDFKTAFPELADPTRSNRNTRSIAAAARDRAVKETYRRMSRQGWEVVTVINLHPYQLDLHMGPLGHLTIPAKKTGEAYASKVIDIPRIAMKDMGDNKFEPFPVFPKEMAEDLVRYYFDNGGIFYYIGTGAPPEELMAQAAESQVKWYFKLYQEGNANWAQFNRNPKHISDRMRDAARELFKLKLIDAAPEWIIVSKHDSPNTPCEGCGQIIPKVAKFCPTCHTIYDADWVKARRPDIWLAQNPGAQMTGVPGGVSGSGFAPDIDGFMEAEQEPPKAPKTKK